MYFGLITWVPDSPLGWCFAIALLCWVCIVSWFTAYCWWVICLVDCLIYVSRLVPFDVYFYFYCSMLLFVPYCLFMFCCCDLLWFVGLIWLWCCWYGLLVVCLLEYLDLMWF